MPPAAAIEPCAAAKKPGIFTQFTMRPVKTVENRPLWPERLWKTIKSEQMSAVDKQDKGPIIVSYRSSIAGFISAFTWALQKRYLENQILFRDSCPAVVRWLSGNCPAIVRRLPND
jgi:hypothetical protein